MRKNNINERQLFHTFNKISALHKNTHDEYMSDIWLEWQYSLDHECKLDTLYMLIISIQLLRLVLISPLSSLHQTRSLGLSWGRDVWLWSSNEVFFFTPMYTGLLFQSGSSLYRLPLSCAEFAISHFSPTIFFPRCFMKITQTSHITTPRKRYAFKVKQLD